MRPENEVPETLLPAKRLPRKRVLALALVVCSSAMVGCSGEDETPRFDVPVVAATAGLLGPKDFEDEGDARARSRALFLEASKVLRHPRCVNCHPTGESPTQGDDMHAHVPPVTRAAPGMFCFSCHQNENIDHAALPGAPGWHLAPASMAWEGRTPRQICEQLKDPKRNGDLDLEKLIEHVATDELVGWGWSPGVGRTPAPGTQKLFASLLRQWVDTGAVCPSADALGTDAETSP